MNRKYFPHSKQALKAHDDVLKNLKNYNEFYWLLLAINLANYYRL